MKQFVAVAVIGLMLGIGGVSLWLQYSGTPRPLHEGWYRVGEGVYLSDGEGRVCGYSSWEQFLNAGGTSGDWVQLEAMPEEIVNEGVCQVTGKRSHRDLSAEERAADKVLQQRVQKPTKNTLPNDWPSRTADY